MQNPSQGVAAPLQNHVHLISLHRFPLIASLNIDQAFRYLLDAPSIVKQIAPMSWNYVQAPQDGTLWLEWIPPEKNEHPFPSDGYVWGDPEQTYRQEVGGYTVELKVHMFGYRPVQEQFAQHARTRYHFVAKNPSINAAPPDPSLWLVHYHQSDQSRLIPAHQVPVSQGMQQVLAQRRWLETQGRLDRKDFMLHDREHWPVVNLPSGAQVQQPGTYGMNPMAALHANQNRYPQAQYSQHGVPPAAKRARTQAPHPMSGPGEGIHDTSIEDEENTAMGDFFDHLTQRDISLARYMQHNRWMEEVFSSPYASNQIVPTDLGLGLMGELKGLTDGILEPPHLDFEERPDNKPLKEKEAQPFTNLSKDQIEEFGKRVEKHLEEGQAELERMKADHAAKMQDWRKVKGWTQAENRLRRATWEGIEGAAPVLRLEQPVANGHGEDGQMKEKVDDVVKSVEETLKVKVISHDGATLVKKGGLKERKQTTYNYDMDGSPQENGFSEMIDIDQFHQPSAHDAQSSAVPSTNLQADTMAQAAVNDALASHSHSEVPPATFAAGATQKPPGTVPGETNDLPDTNTAGEALADMPDMDMNDTMMDGMDIDLDVEEPGIDLDSSQPDDELSTSAAALQPQQQALQGQPVEGDDTSAMFSAPLAPVTTTQNTARALSGDAIPSAPSPAPPAPAPPLSDQSSVPKPVSNFEEPVIDTAGDDMFNDAFDDLGNIDGAADDGLIDFDDGDGLGMEDSAFGDALHGMDTGTDSPAAE